MADDRTPDRAKIEGMSAEDLARVQALLAEIGGRNVSWGAASVLEVWLAESRLEAERLASRRMLTATWVLGAATVALVFATIGLIVVGA